MTERLCGLIEHLNSAIANRMELEVALFECRESIEEIKARIEEELENVR